MNFDSPYFDDVDAALGAAETLVTEDFVAARDRQIIANFYNGRETMSQDEAEKEGVKNVVNHLFGYNSLDQLRTQLNSIFTADDRIWTVISEHPAHLQDQNLKNAFETYATEQLNLRIKRSKRLKPQARAFCGNLVLHGRDSLVFTDKFDWCPQSKFFYVPGDTGTIADTFTYAFSFDNIPLWRLKSYLKKAEAAGDASSWNPKALREAIASLEESCGMGTTKTVDFQGEENPSANFTQDEVSRGRRGSSMTLPVWYLYEVDHDKPEKPISMSIIAKYTAAEGDEKMEKVERERLLYTKKGHFKSIRHWLYTCFIDTEIGGTPTWHGVMGIGKLNFPRDADVEEFFNLAMDGAKDNCRMKWKLMDGASREKAMRFFQERSDLIPEGLEAAPAPASGQFKEAFNVINALRMLSKEDAGAGYTNMGQSGDELEIQAQERQSRASALVASRMADVYDMLDDVGTEIVRRFMIGENSKSNPGYLDVKNFRECLESHGYTQEQLNEWCKEESGTMKYIFAKTSRAAGDGSAAREMAVNDRMMGALGIFTPEAQELIKRRTVLSWTRDPDFAAAVVPFQYRPDPDQLARARNENTSALSRGIIGFVPQLNADDVAQIHVPEHSSELDALIAKATEAGSMTPMESAGFKSLATHQMMHVKAMQGDKRLAEVANAAEQKLQEQSRQAEGLTKAYATNNQEEELTQAEKIKFTQKNRELDQRDRAQASVEADREKRREIDERKAAVDEVTAISSAAAKSAQVTQPTPVQAVQQ